MSEVQQPERLPEPGPPTGASRRTWRRRTAQQLALMAGGVTCRRDLRQAGIDHDEVRSEVRAGRWTPLGRQTVAPAPPELFQDPAQGPPGLPARHWWAVWESGHGAVLDGVSALIAHGMKGFEEKTVHITVPRNGAPELPGVRTRRARELVRCSGGGIPRVPVAVAVVHAAQWAVSDRQAALLVAMPVQQRLIPGLAGAGLLADAAALPASGVPRCRDP